MHLCLLFYIYLFIYSFIVNFTIGINIRDFLFTFLDDETETSKIEPTFTQKNLLQEDQIV